jgi:hypothetical protein
MPTALRSVGLLDVLSSTSAGPSGRAPCIRARLRRLATKPSEKSGLGRSAAEENQKMDPATRKFHGTPVIIIVEQVSKLFRDLVSAMEHDLDRIPGTHAINLMARAFNAMPAFSDPEIRAECWKTSKRLRTIFFRIRP